MKSNKWTAAQMPSLAGKIAVVTGANSGLGYESAKAMAVKGAEVVMACRSLRKAEEAAAWIREEVPGAVVHVMGIDLASLSSIKAFSEKYLERFSRLDILLNNAGLMALPYCRTEDGFEMQFGTNHLGHFALTMQLLPAICATEGARVVQVSSGAHVFGSFNWQDLNWEQSYSKWRAYGRSKLANLLFALELNRRFEEAGYSAIAMAAHPGYASTNLFGRTEVQRHSAIERFFLGLGGNGVAQSAEMGALPQLFAATSIESKGGRFYGPDGFLGLKGYPHEASVMKRFSNPLLWKKLWDASEALTGTKFT